MQAYKVKLTHAKAKLLQGIIKLVYATYDEREAIADGDYEILFIMCSLRGLYSKLNTATEFQYPGEKSFKLKPAESLALHTIVACGIIEFGPMSWEQNILQSMSDELHQHALIEGRYLELPEVAAHKLKLGSNHLHQIGPVTNELK